MIRIAICDDENILLDKYIKIINSTRKKYKFNIEISTFNSGEELINDILINDTKFELIFLDIIMGKMNGIDTARKIRQTDDSSEIVFLTSSKEYALEGYDIRAHNYIMKNDANLEEKICEEIKYIYSKSNDYIIIKNKSELEKISISEIVYVESDKRKIIINTKGCKYDTYEKLDTIYEKIKKFGFIKSHRSYIVNMDFIQKIESKDIVTTNENRIPISRGKVDEVRQEFMYYLESMM